MSKAEHSRRGTQPFHLYRTVPGKPDGPDTVLCEQILAVVEREGRVRGELIRAYLGVASAERFARAIAECRRRRVIRSDTTGHFLRMGGYKPEAKADPASSSVPRP